MFIRNFSKVFSFAKRGNSHLRYFSKNSSLQMWPQFFPKPVRRTSRSYDPYYFNYLINKMDRYSFVYDTDYLYEKKENESEIIKVISDLNNKDFLENENYIYEILKNAETELDSYGVDEICKILFWTCNRFPSSCMTQLHHFKRCIDTKLCGMDFSTSELLKFLFTVKAGCYQFHTKNHFFFNYKAVMRFFRKIDHLSIPEVVQVFYCIPDRDLSDYENKFSLYEFLNENINMFNSDELGIIARGLLVGNIICHHDSICDSVLDKTANELENIHSVPLIDICEVVQKLLGFKKADKLLDFQEKVTPYVSGFRSKTLLSVVSMGSKFKILNPNLKTAAVKKWKECIEELTFSEVSKLIYMTAFFNIQDEDIYSLAIKNMEGVTSKKDYPVLISFLSNLSFHNLYPENLLLKVFSEDFLPEIIDDFGVSTKVHWWNLYWNRNLENLDCVKKEFDFSLLEKLYKKIRHRGKILFSQQTIKLYSFYRIIENILEARYGKNKFLLIDVLPHFDVVLVMRFNKKLEAQDIPEQFYNVKDFLKKPLDDGHYWISILILLNYDFLWSTDTLCLSSQTQCKQLKALGYNVITVKLRSLRERNREEFITNLIQTNLENLSNENNKTETY